jgi:hypothetical protein
MKLFLSTALALLFIFTAHQSQAQQRPFGVGIILGEPTGISAKLWTSHDNAFDFALGWTAFNHKNSGSSIHIHADYLWHAFNALTTSQTLPVYYGIGGRFNGGSGNETSFAVRGVFGLAWMPRSVPIDVFLEVAPSLELTPSVGFGIDAAIGARYYF